MHFVRKNVRKRRKKHAANPVIARLCGLFTMSGFMSGIAGFELTCEQLVCGTDSFFLRVGIAVKCMKGYILHSSITLDCSVLCYLYHTIKLVANQILPATRIRHWQNHYSIIYSCLKLMVTAVPCSGTLVSTTSAW